MLFYGVHLMDLNVDIGIGDKFCQQKNNRFLINYCCLQGQLCNDHRVFGSSENLIWILRITTNVMNVKANLQKMNLFSLSV